MDDRVQSTYLVNFLFLCSPMFLAPLNSPVSSRRGIDCLSFLGYGTLDALKSEVCLAHFPSSAFRNEVTIIRIRLPSLDLCLARCGKKM